jgi:hypothetical protein
VGATTVAATAIDTTTAVVTTAAAAAAAAAAAGSELQPQQLQQQAQPAAADAGAPVPPPVLAEFEHKLEADLNSVGLTLAAVTGVIVYWRGVWTLLDWLLDDSLLGALSCMLAGLSVVLWLRLSGAKVATTFWPPG